MDNVVDFIELSHIKIHFKADKDRLFNQNKCLCTTKKTVHKNFCVHKSVPFTYIIFHSGFINAVGIRVKDDITKAVEHFCTLNHLSKKDISSITIDNITAKGKLRHSLSLERLFHFSKKVRGKYLSNYNPLHFPSLNLSFTYGKILLFKNGKFSAVGIRCIEDIINIRHEMDVFINQFYTMNMKEPQFVQTVH